MRRSLRVETCRAGGERCGRRDFQGSTSGAHRAARHAVGPTGSPTTSNSAPITPAGVEDRKSTRLTSSHVAITYAVFCLKKKSNPARHLLFESQKNTHTSTR